MNYELEKELKRALTTHNLLKGFYIIGYKELKDEELINDNDFEYPNDLLSECEETLRINEEINVFKTLRGKFKGETISWVKQITPKGIKSFLDEKYLKDYYQVSQLISIIKTNKISSRTAIGTIILAAVATIIAGISLFRQIEQDKQATKQQELQLKEVQELHNMQQNFQSIDSVLKNLIHEASVPRKNFHK